MKRLTMITGLVFVGALISGCAIIDLNRALSDGPDAEEAVLRIDEPSSLESVSLNGKNQKARALAISKINKTSRLCWFVMNGDAPGELRVAALNRLVAMGKAADMLENESGFAEVVLSDGSGSTRGKSCAPCGFPLEWRIKAVQCKGSISRDALQKVAQDSNAPLELRKVAIQRGGLSTEGCALILEENENIANALLSKLPSRELSYILCELMSGHGSHASFKVRTRVFKYILSVPDFRKINDNGGSVLSDALSRALRRTDEDDGKDDNVKFMKHTISEVKDAKALGCFVRWNSKTKYEEYLTLATKQIKDDKVLIEILKDKDILLDVPSVATTAVEMLQDGKLKQRWGDIVLAKCSPELKVRGEALMRVCAADQKEAYKIVFEWFLNGEHREGAPLGVDLMKAVTDLKTLVGVLQLCKKDERDFAIKKVMPGIKKGLLAYSMRQVESMSPDKLGQLVKAQTARSEKLAAEGKTCVIANRYVGMSIVSFIALNKISDVKSVPIDWDFDDKSERVVMREIAFDSKNVFKATGVEKTNVQFSLPKKLGIAPFELGITKLQYNENDLAKYFGDYSLSFSGGDAYYRSESQEKGVVVLFWKKTGQLVLSVIE